MKLSVVIPVYNERETIREILQRVRAVDVDKEIIIVDDFSSDGTRTLLEELAAGEAKILFHEKNLGKGAAVRTGVRHVTGDCVIIQDADLEYDPQDYHTLLAPLLRGETEVVYGSRFAGARRTMPVRRWAGNRLLTLLTNLLYRATISDMETCYKVFRAPVIKNIEIKSDRFNFEPEITAKILKQGIRIHEVPISYTGRRYSEGKKITWKDGLSAVWALIKYRFAN